VLDGHTTDEGGPGRVGGEVGRAREGVGDGVGEHEDRDVGAEGGGGVAGGEGADVEAVTDFSPKARPRVRVSQRLSEDPRRGVVGGFGEFHGVPGLFVADASLFPGPTGINPMETVIALAMRNARWLIEHRHRWGL